MTARNPFHFIDPLLLQIPANKYMDCPSEVFVRPETYFDGVPVVRVNRWSFDNYYLSADCPFDPKQRRGDRQNIERRMDAIYKTEKQKKVPVCSQSWYGHRVAKYDQRLTTFSFGSRAAMTDCLRPNGMSWPKQERETAV